VPARSALPIRPTKSLSAIDGQPERGRATVARHLAQHFGLLNLETGPCTAPSPSRRCAPGLPIDGELGPGKPGRETSIRLEPGEDGNRVLLDDEDVTGLIRNQTVTTPLPGQRMACHSSWMVCMQQEMGARGGVVMEAATSALWSFPGRSQNLFGRCSRSAGPATLRSAWTQARYPPQEVIRDLRARDERDRNRADSPLKPAPTPFCWIQPI